MLIMGSNPLAKGSPMYDPPLPLTWLSYDPPPLQRKGMVSWTLSYASGMHVQQSTMSDGSLMTPSVPQRPRARGLLPYVLAWAHQYHQQRYPRRTIYGHDIIPLK